MNKIHNTSSKVMNTSNAPKVGHGTGSRIKERVEEIPVGGEKDLDFWRMRGDKDFESLVFHIQRGIPPGFEGKGADTLKALYGEGLKDTYFLSMWVGGEKVSKGTKTDLVDLNLPIAFGKDDLIIFLRAMLSSPVREKKDSALNF